MINLKQRSLIGLAALFAIASAQACSSSDEPAGTPAGGAPAAGAPAGGSTAAGGAAAGAAPAGGTAAGGAPAGGTSAIGGTGGATAGSGGTGGAVAGSGGSAAGSAGKGGTGSAGGGSAGAAGGGSTATYAAVKAIFTASCGTTCHNGNPHTNFTTGELYTTLSTAIPATPATRDCKGSTLITANDGPNSLLVKIITGATTCQNSGASQSIARMPNGCSGNSCLSADKIKTISDWISAGAPH